MSTEDTPAPIPERQPWQMLEAEYIDWAVAREIRLAAARPRLTPQQRSRLERFTRRTEGVLQSVRRWYYNAVKRALKEGQPVPEAVLAQDPAYRRMVDGRQRYLKGRHTAFANVSRAIDLSMQDEFGVKVKRQDGRPITEPQKAEIAAALREVESVVGPLAGILRGVDATVSHTSGKRPYLRNAGGLYVPGERTISFGVCDSRGVPVKAFAHELAHLLDGEAGPRAADDGRARDYLSEGRDERPVFVAILRRMNVEEHRLARLAKLRKQDTEDEEEKVVIERRYLHLGTYWRRSCEVFARLFEQLVSTQLSGRVAVAAEADYTERPGWWSGAVFAGLRDQVVGMARVRLDILRRERAGS